MSTVLWAVLVAVWIGPAEPDARLLDAIRAVESGGNRAAVGDNGRSLGAYQIGEDYWRDACEYGGVDWDYRTGVKDERKCRQVIRWYWARYGARTDEHKARTHVGGPKGYLRAVTLPYWNRVKYQLVSSKIHLTGRSTVVGWPVR